MDETTIERRPTGVDFREIHDLLHRAYAYMDERIDPPSSLHRMSPDDFARKALEEDLIIARKGNRIVACLFAAEHGAHLYVGKIAVDPDLQGLGIGGKLMRAATQLARERGMIGLELQHRIVLDELARWYASLGFRVVGEMAHDGYDEPTTVTLRKTLD